MATAPQAIAFLKTQSCAEQFAMLYGHGDAIRDAQMNRHEALLKRFYGAFSGGEVRVFSAPGRAEIGGNHTDHQSGRVLAASINLDTVAAAAPNGSMAIRIDSAGYPPIQIDLADLAPREAERGTSAAVARGVAARLAASGHAIGGFDAAVVSDVLGGSGLSSSAAFEVMLCRVFDGLFGDGRMTPAEIAIIAQYAENQYFGKPCGLLDQMGCATGGLAAMDFERPEPSVEAIAFDFAAHGYALAVVNTGGSHDDLTDAYAAIPREMASVAKLFGKERLRFVDPLQFEAEIPSLYGKVSDRALLRAMHYFDEDARVPGQVNALKEADLLKFFSLIQASGESSIKLLQNIFASPGEQPLSLALALSARFLAGQGACRVHGGGFAGTILSFVPLSMLSAYQRRMDSVFGQDACQPLRIRPVGAYELQME